MKNLILVVFVFLIVNVAKSQTKTVTLLEKNINSLKVKYIKISNLDSDEIQYKFSLDFSKPTNSYSEHLKGINFETKIEYNAFYKDLTSAYTQMNSGEAADVKWDREKYRLSLYDTTIIPIPDLILAENDDLSTKIRLNKRNLNELLKLMSSIDFLDKTPSNTSSNLLNTDKSDSLSESKKEEDEIYTAVEQQAEFPGGPRAFGAHLQRNLKYPSAAQRKNVGGKVYVRFVVNTDGSTEDFEILKSVGFGCDEEAIRVVKSVPKWNPAKTSGRAVRSRLTQPITFVLSE